MIPVRGFEGRKVAVFGLGRTGLTAARALRAGRFDKACEAAEWYARTFPGRFYLELQDNRLHAQINQPLSEIGKKLGLPLVATNDCHYLHRDDAKAHEVLLCIQTGKTMADETRWRFDTDELYVKTPIEMATAFGGDTLLLHGHNRFPLLISYIASPRQFLRKSGRVARSCSK